MPLVLLFLTSTIGSALTSLAGLLLSSQPLTGTSVQQAFDHSLLIDWWLASPQTVAGVVALFLFLVILSALAHLDRGQEQHYLIEQEKLKEKANIEQSVTSAVASARRPMQDSLRGTTKRAIKRELRPLDAWFQRLSQVFEMHNRETTVEDSKLHASESQNANQVPRDIPQQPTGYEQESNGATTLESPSLQKASEQVMCMRKRY